MIWRGCNLYFEVEDAVRACGICLLRKKERIESMTDEDYMRVAIGQARKAANTGDVPVGAVIVCRGKIIAKAHNRKENKQNALAHAEILAIEKACKKRKSWRLDACAMYVTLEPCAMCAGALAGSRIEKLYYGARDLRAGACGSAYRIADDGNLNHKIEVTEGLLREECAALVTDFFKDCRRQNKNKKSSKQGQKP